MSDIMKSVLIVEDEPKIAGVLSDYLESSGFSAAVMDRGDGVAELVRRAPPDLIILDVSLPGKDGMAICREIRAFSPVPIIMVTARVEEIDRLLGLELGADDYVCKPFSPREVVARVKAVLRRSAAGEVPEGAALRAGPVTLDPETRRVTAGGIELDLTPTEFELLRALVSRPGRVYTRDDLTAKVQGYDFEGYERTIDTHIKNLRAKLRTGVPETALIQTVYGVGYKFADG